LLLSRFLYKIVNPLMNLILNLKNLLVVHFIYLLQSGFIYYYLDLPYKETRESYLTSSFTCFELYIKDLLFIYNFLPNFSIEF